jgi:uncharacterized protein
MDTFIEKEITIQGKFNLSGTLSVPAGLKGKAPAVLFIHGSGNVDRDENVKNLPINAFKHLSDDLVSQGFVTLRYDKRGVGKSEGDFWEMGFWDLVDDAESAVKFLKEQSEVDADTIILIGHSEGCVIAPTLYDRLPVQGIVLLAGIVGGVFDASAFQVQEVMDEIKTMKGPKGFFMRLLVQEKKAKAQNKKFYGRIMASDKAVMRYMGHKVNAKWIREHRQYIVDDVLKKIGCPVLAITGSKDVQVHPDDARRMGDIVKSSFEYHIIPDMNHLLRKQEEPLSILKLIKIYKKLIKNPLEPRLIELLNDWMKQFLEKEGQKQAV